MARNSNRQAVPELPFSLTLNSSLLDSIDKDSLRQTLIQEILTIFNEMGIPGSPALEITAIQPNDILETPILSLMVADDRLLYPMEIAHRAYEYVSGQTFTKPHGKRGLMNALLEMSSDQGIAFVTELCVEIIKRNCDRLLTKEAFQTYLESLSSYLQMPLDFSSEDLHSALASVLNFRISISDLEKVAQTIQPSAETREFENLFDDLGSFPEYKYENNLTKLREALIEALGTDLIEIQLSQRYLRELSLNITDAEMDFFKTMREGLFYELGLRFPSFRFVTTEDLYPRGLRFKINHVTTMAWRGLDGHEYYVNDTPDRLNLLNIQGKASSNPANRSIGSLIHRRDVPLAREAGLTAWSPVEFIILALSSELRSHAQVFMKRSLIADYFDELATSMPQLIESVREFVPLGALIQALRLLLLEQISIRNTIRILQAMVDFYVDPANQSLIAPPGAAGTLPVEWSHDPTHLASFVRIVLKGQVCQKYTRSENTLVVTLLDEEIEALLDNSRAEGSQASRAKPNPATQDKILDALEKQIGILPPESKNPVVLTNSWIRPIFRELITLRYPHIPVMSYQELARDLTIQPLARISLT